VSVAKIDLTGMVFGRLTVIEKADDHIEPSGAHRAKWLCECSCANHTVKAILEKNLLDKRGGTKSCGCIAKELSSLREKEYNKYDISGSVGIGWTNNSNKEFYFDLEDYDKIKDYCWYEHTNSDGYTSLQTNIKNENSNKRITIKMHWLLTSKNCDHADRNPLNNCKSNLRPATSQENARNHSKQKNNTSGFIGVSWHKGRSVWVSSITINKKKMYLGEFCNKHDAIIARLTAESRYFKEFAPQRHLFEEYDIKLVQDNNLLTIQN
jgi:hypothetical protein